MVVDKQVCELQYIIVIGLSGSLIWRIGTKLDLKVLEIKVFIISSNKISAYYILHSTYNSMLKIGKYLVFWRMLLIFNDVYDFEHKIGFELSF